MENVMRSALAIALAITMSTAGAAVWAENAPAAAPAPAPAAAPAPAKAACNNPNALGVERVVQIDTTCGPGFGFEHFKAYDFLRDKEVVLTFDDGPWPVSYTHLRAHETVLDLVCRLLLEKKKTKK